MPVNWAVISRVQKKNEKIFYEQLGEKVENLEIEEFYEMYEMVKETAKKAVDQIGKGKTEKEYQNELLNQLHELNYEVKEELCETYEDGGEIKRIIIDIMDTDNEDSKIIFELKICVRRVGIKNLLKYMKLKKSNMGYLVCFRKHSIKIYSVINIDNKYFWYDGENTYKKDEAPDGAVFDLAE